MTRVSLRLEDISFSTLQQSDAHKAWNFMAEYFFPDEPIFRSSRMLDSESWFYSYFKYLLYDFYITKNIHFGESILAKDPEGNVVGLCLGSRVRADDDTKTKALYGNWLFLDLMEYLPAWMRPTSVHKAVSMCKLDYMLRYDPFMALDDLKCSTLFVGDTLCVAKTARGIGLGKILLQRSVEFARSSGYAYYFALASGLYSQAIFGGCGFEVMRRAAYAEVLDDFGQPVIDLPGEHTHAQTVSLKLQQ